MILFFVFEVMAWEAKAIVYYVEALIGLISWNLNILNMLIVDGIHFRFLIHDHFLIKLHSLYASSEYHD